MMTIINLPQSRSHTIKNNALAVALWLLLTSGCSGLTAISPALQASYQSSLQAPISILQTMSNRDHPKTETSTPSRFNDGSQFSLLLLAANSGVDGSTSEATGVERLRASLQTKFQSPPNKKGTSKYYKSDTVIRVLDANTIKLEQGGLVSLAGVQTPLTGGFPDCFSSAPSKKLQQLLPKNSAVQLLYLPDSDSTTTSSSSLPRVLLIVPSTTTANDNTSNNIRLVNSELIRFGYAKPAPRGRIGAEEVLPGFTQALTELNLQAKQQQLGLYQQCDPNSSPPSSSSLTTNNIKSINNDQQDQAIAVSRIADINLKDQFEPIKYTTQIRYGIDGGKKVRVVNENVSTAKAIPKDPGDRVGCSDFETYEDALKYYETYFAYYGDVAKLDRDGDGVPCPKLDHTQNMDKFRRKVPTKSIGFGDKSHLDF